MARRILTDALCAAALAAWAAGAAVAAVSAGDSAASLGIGVGIPLSGLDLARFRGGPEAPGGTGPAVNTQFLHYATPHLGLGGELSYLSFSGRDVVRPKRPDLTVDGSLLSLEGVAQVLAAPAARVSPYLIGGLGLSRFSARVSERRDPEDVLLDDDATRLAISLGGGVRAELSETLSAMGELRWRFATTDAAAFGTGTANALAVLFRLGWKL